MNWQQLVDETIEPERYEFFEAPRYQFELERRDFLKVLGGGIVGTHAGDLIGEVCLAVEMGCDPVDVGKTIHPHPTLCESIGMAAEVFEGVCTDLPPAKKR